MFRHAVRATQPLIAPPAAADRARRATIDANILAPASKSHATDSPPVRDIGAVDSNSKTLAHTMLRPFAGAPTLPTRKLPLSFARSA